MTAFDAGFPRSSRVHIARVLSLAVSLAACAPRGGIVTAPISVPGVRGVDVASGRDLSFDELTRRLAGADVVFFGEQHDDPETHRVEFGLLDALGRTGRPVILSFEMFERDAQPMLNDYLAGRMSESDFLAKSRPWDRYVTDYRPMVELAKAKGWPVVASNIPRPMASAVGRKGLAALDTLTPIERGWAARDIQCPEDAYRARFVETMRGHSPGGALSSPGDTLPTAVATRFYLAQCIKDETMGESIAAAFAAAPPRALVVHVNGAFHSDYRFGTAERAQRRLRGKRVAVVSFVPVPDLDRAEGKPQRKLGDYVVFTLAPPKTPAAPAGR